MTPTPRPRGRGNDPAATRQNILEVAIREFAKKGLAGARIDEIAAQTSTSKRMIYYYFRSKQGLYLAVLEKSYRDIRHIEETLHLESLPPIEAVRTLVGFTFDYQAANPNFVRLVMNENMQNGRYLAQSASIKDLNIPAIDGIREIYARGCAQGLFRPGLDPIDLHASISALCFFNVSNQHTFSLIFKRDIMAPEAYAQRRQNVIDMILRYMLA
ncbi:TetR/AcrR family transcriptional regulator [Castellaniella defragrans]|jgi:AcrR family transcriptional regulator|uniref:Transcriptional regulator, TetR family n=1 Tax=Castellaniella defragrans (strain DSM 12143 / CCUG 39792 / 65Phen) TaxID=1437824 RepID=W8X036_CASD6|nr:TetR/AcrR family transcriptional regulator [Castellaniella defragrans]CDM22627.1 transcriptional regulator, TetR family [Castellaniella defragrans 65Phen]